MIAVIRIKGQVGLKGEIVNTLNRLRLKKKYSCVVLGKPTKEQIGMIEKLKNVVAYGEITKETLEKLIGKRGQLIDKSKAIDAKKIAEELMEGKSPWAVDLKPFFRLHPPRGGIESKKHFGVGKGVLGDNGKKINDLIRRML